jgi:predicted TIM-barrel fold metal-dependent hydrolase
MPARAATASLGRRVEIIREIVGREPPAHQEKLFAENAERIYRLKS